MAPSEHTDDSWQEVRWGKKKNRRLPQTTSGGRGIPNSQAPSQKATTGRIAAQTQPIRQTPPNVQVQPARNSHPKVASKKEAIPYEIKNRREWDEEKRLQDGFLSDSSSDDDYDMDDFEWPQVYGSATPNTRDDASQPASSKPSIPHAQPLHPATTFAQAHSRSKGPSPHRPHRRARFNFKKDNLARAAFRKRLAPSGMFKLPRDCPDIEPNQKRMYDTFDEIGVRLGSFIRPPQHVKDRELLLWGNVHQVQNTVDELSRWLDRRLHNDVPQKAMAKDNFARELSTIGDQHRRLMKKVRKEAMILEFQQAPAEGRVFLYTGTFIWPVDEVQPEDILGPSLEAFDPIRFQYQCHIVFDHKLSSFRIFSDKEDSITRTMDRMVGTMKEYVAKSVRPDRMILVEPPKPSAIRKDVMVIPLSLDDAKAEPSMIPVLTGGPLDQKSRCDLVKKGDELARNNIRRIEFSLRKCIANLRHHRGLVRIRIQFGTFALKLYRWKPGADSMPFEEFVNNVSMPATKGVLVRDLQLKKDATTITTTIQNATGLFLPIDSSSTSLEEVEPSFSACFEFQNPDSQSFNYTLEVRNSAAAPTIYEKVSELWTRTDRRNNAVPLEIFTARFDSGASWELKVSTENGIDPSRVNPRMAEFAESVKLAKIPRTKTELTGHKVFTWNKDLPSAMQPSTFQQKTALRYRLTRHPEWEFEIARYDSYGNPKSENVPVETNWGATLFNTNWDSILTGNSTLGIGETAKWSPKLETFFPSRFGSADVEGIDGTDPGVMEFLQIVDTVLKFIDSLKKELPHLRGQVGGRY